MKIVKMKVQRMQDRMLWRITQTCFTDKSSADFYDIKRIICSNKNCIKHVFRSVCVCVCFYTPILLVAYFDCTPE